jgi:hypothetical protein
MRKIKKYSHRLIVSACLASLLLAGMVSSASAFNDWFKKGADLLNRVTEEDSPSLVATLSDSDIALGLKDALKVGSERVVAQLGAEDGFNVDPRVHIPLPEKFEIVKTTLQKVGMGGMLDDLELKLNRAAEKATPEAKQLFWTAIEEMTLEDVQGIYSGADDAATEYFKGKMSLPLGEAMAPLVDETLAEVGAIQMYDQVMQEYQSIPFVPNVKADLNGYVVEKGLEGIFYYLAQEEAAIRQDPVKRTTEILQKVFAK